MNASEHRPKSIRPIEAAVLLAATALGLAGAWYHLRSPCYRVYSVGAARTYTPANCLVFKYGGSGPGALGVVLATWSPALLWVGWRRRGPGRGGSPWPWLACPGAASVAAGPHLGTYLFEAAFRGWPMAGVGGRSGGGDGDRIWSVGLAVDRFATEILGGLGGVVVPAVLGALLFSILTARGRPRGWVEWASLLLGLGWLGVGALRVLGWSQDPGFHW